VIAAGRRLDPAQNVSGQLNGSYLDMTWDPVSNADFYEVVMTVVFGTTTPNYKSITYTTTSTSKSHDRVDDHSTTYEYRFYVKACKNADAEDALTSYSSQVAVAVE